ncbi:MAG: hypothetical protein P8X95_26410, partial [Anaerolineales bacterium]
MSSQLIPEKLRRTSDLIRNEIDTIQALQMHYKEFAEQRLKQLKYIVKENEKTAIVIGASMGGLLAARALADHFAQVTLLERDVFPEPGENRKGVPQGKHAHVLWALGRDIMERYLPGLAEELTRLGAVNIADVGSNVRWFDKGGYYQPGASGVAGIGVSRPTLEAAVRKRVLALPNVRAFTGCNVLDLVTTANKERITGVRLVRNGARGSQERMMADLVIDASGRGSRSPAWLEKLGYQRPPEEEVRIGLGYTSRFYRHRPGRWPGLNGIVSMAHPPNKRLGALCDQDGDRWVVTLAGYLRMGGELSVLGLISVSLEFYLIFAYEIQKNAAYGRATLTVKVEVLFFSTSVEITVEKRIERLREEMSKGKNREVNDRELALFDRLHEALEAEIPLRDLPYTPTEAASLRGYRFLTMKPQMALLNIGDDEEEPADVMEALAEKLPPGSLTSDEKQTFPTPAEMGSLMVAVGLPSCSFLACRWTTAAPALWAA